MAETKDAEVLLEEIKALGEYARQLYGIDESGLNALHSSLGQGIVKLLVGPDEKEYELPKANISKIPFFKNAFKSSMQEGVTSTIGIYDVDTDVFDLACYWLQYQSIPMPEVRTRGSFEGEYEGSKQEKYELRLLAIYHLAQKWCCPALKNAAMRIIHKFYFTTQMLVGTRMLEAIDLPRSSPLRRFLVQEFVYSLQEEPSWAGSNLESMVGAANGDTFELAVDIIRCLNKKRKDAITAPHEQPVDKFLENED